VGREMLCFPKDFQDFSLKTLISLGFSMKNRDSVAPLHLGPLRGERRVGGRGACGKRWWVLHSGLLQISYGLGRISCTWISTFCQILHFLDPEPTCWHDF